MNIKIKNMLKIILWPLLWLEYKIFLYIGKHNPQLMVKIYYAWNLHKKISLEHPADLNEKINWLKFNSDTTIWSVLADKYRVREYVKSCGLENILVKLYGVWEKAENINFENLPNSLVLKTNNSCTTVLLVRDKNKLDKATTINKLNQWLRINQDIYISVELHYSKIKPLIIAEELLSNDKSEISSSIIDYKFWCFHGEPYCILVCYDRQSDGHASLALYDLAWNNIDYNLVEVFRSDKKIPRPDSLNEMIKICRTLSKSFPQVRVDLYEVHGQPKFGEMTFTALGGFMNYFTPHFLLEMGEKVDLSVH